MVSSDHQWRSGKLIQIRRSTTDQYGNKDDGTIAVASVLQLEAGFRTCFGHCTVLFTWFESSDLERWRQGRIRCREEQYASEGRPGTNL